MNRQPFTLVNDLIARAIISLTKLFIAYTEESTLSSGSQNSEEQRATARKNLARAFRQFAGLSASFFRAAAARTGVTVTDVQVLDILAEGNPMTAGQLAD